MKRLCQKYFLPTTSISHCVRVKFVIRVYIIASAALSLCLLLLPAGAAMARTFSVNSLTDSPDVDPGDGVCLDYSGLCSLRAAVMEANAHTGADTVVFDTSTDGGTSKFTVLGRGEDAAATGDLDITDDLTIVGNGADKTVIDAGNNDRVFDILSTSGTIAAELDDLTVRGGGVSDDIAAIGSGIRVRNASLRLNSDIIQGNQAVSATGEAAGGGVAVVNGELTLDHTTVKDNPISAGTSALGGGIAAIRPSRISIFDGSVVADNIAHSDGAGHGAMGGGIYAVNGSSLNVDSSTIDGNLATNTSESAYGGGIEVVGGTYLITNSEIGGNTAQGGTVAFGGGLDVEHTEANSAIINTTFTSNLATADTTSGSADGGAVSIDSTPVGITEELANVTITGNSVDAGGSGGGGLDIYQNQGTVLVQNSIVAGNQDAQASAPDCIGIGASIASGGYNLIGDATGCAFSNTNGDQVGTGSVPIDPMLGALADNGGKTQTIALLADSPAVDAGNPDGCTDSSGSPLSTDQREDPRPIDGNSDGAVVCDIGAYERAADSTPSNSTPINSTTSNSGGGGSVGASVLILLGLWILQCRCLKCTSRRHGDDEELRNPAYQ